MNETIIPPSASWYLSGILGVSGDGSMLAYGAKHEIVLFNITESGSETETPDIQKRFVPIAHRERITCLAFSPSAPYKLVTASDDATVKVWHTATLDLLYSHSGHTEGHKLSGVDWSRANENTVVSVSDGGSVVCWDLVSNTIRRLYIGSRMSPTVVACSPHDKHVVAIGAKAGLIIIYNIRGDGHVMFRIRGHESDVVSLAWCPTPENIFRKGSSENVCLLASGAKDRTIYLWRTATDGRFETCLNLPQQPLATTYRNKSGVGGAGNCWICVRWPSTHTLLMSSQFGELLSYNLHNLIVNSQEKNPQEGGSKKQSKNKGFKLVHANHSKGLFSIAVPPFKSLKDGENPLVWSCALDKHLVAARLSTCKVVVDITAIGGIVYCLAASPLDPNRLALGLGDNKILVWNMSNSAYTDVATYWHKINNKVMAVAWHPTLESVLAFGTGEGRIGVMDVSNNKPPIVLRLHHRRSVYSVIWAPPIIQPTEKRSSKWELALFSVGDGDILQYDVETPDKEPIDLGPLLSKCDSVAMMGKSLGRTDLAWNHDRTFAAIGNDNGVVYIVDGKTLEHKETVFAHKKLVQCIVWHPPTVTSEMSMSPHASWLASASDNIHVINVTQQGFEVVMTLTSHTEKVVSLAWSPHFNARLISASYDYTCQVWDVISGSVLAVYDCHHNAVVSCMASPLHPDFVITGSSDSTLRVWNINNHMTISKPKSKKQRISGAAKKFAGVQEAWDITAAESKPMPEKQKVDSGKNNTTAAPTEGKTELVGTEAQLKRKNKSMFPIMSSSIAHAKHLNVLWDRISRPEGDTTADQSIDQAELQYLDFFGDSEGMLRLLAVESSQHRESGHVMLSEHMSLWAGNMSDVIKEASRKKTLNDWLVSLAPIISHKLWLECCGNYASQLVESGDPLKASSYYLAMHRVDDAVQVLIDAKMMREAVALAKSRLTPKDPTTVNALVAWANQANNNGMLNLAAHCLVSAGRVNEAVEILSRSKEAESLSLAGRMAASCSSADMATSLVVRSLNISLTNSQYTAAHNTLQHHPHLHDLCLWIDACALIEEWESNVYNAKSGVEWLCKSCTVTDTDTECCNILQVLNDMYKEKQVSYELLSRHMPVKPPRDSIKKTWIYIGSELCLAVAADSDDTKMRHVINALNAAYTSICLTPQSSLVFIKLVTWISPRGPLAELEFNEGGSKSLKESIKTFLTCGALYWLDHLLSTQQLNHEVMTKLSQSESSAEVIIMYDLIRSAASLILTKETLTYYKNGVKMKRLENSIAAAKLNLPTIKYCSDVEAELCRELEHQQLNNGEPNKNGGLLIKQLPEMMTEFPSTSSSEEELSLDEIRSSLERMKEFNRKFETERLFSPNPFVTYCCLTNTVESLMRHNNKACAGNVDTADTSPVPGEQLLKQINEMWEAASNEQ